MRNSSVLKKLRADKAALVTNVGASNAPFVCEMIGRIGGFDCIWIDMEHRPLTMRDTCELIRGARAGGVDTCVRIRKDAYWSFFRPLEDGATGLMLPHCMSPDEARWAVRNMRFAPEGLRGFDNAGADADYLQSELSEFMSHANQETFLVVQIEDHEAVACVEDIAAVKGVDVLFVGAADLSQSYGVPGQFRHERIREAIRRVAAAAKNNGCHWGVSMGTPNAAQEAYEQGARFINCSSDIGIMSNGFRAIRDEFNQLYG